MSNLTLSALAKNIEYSDKYYDDKYEYRHVILPKEILKILIDHKKDKQNLREDEWRAIGIQMSKGWIHYGYHDPEPHILLFKRLFKGVTPRVQMEMQMAQMEQEQQAFQQ
jgi:cyclin-dependent kinase regulatory subunit CKS1